METSPIYRVPFSPMAVYPPLMAHALVKEYSE